MIFIGPHVFEFYEGNNKIFKLRCVHEGEMGPYRTDKTQPGGLHLSRVTLEAYRPSVRETLLAVAKKNYNDGYFIPDKIIRILESLAKTYEFKDLTAWFERYWQKEAQIAETNGLHAEAKLRPYTEHDTDKQIREFKDEIALTDDGPALRTARISYLEGQKAKLSSHLAILDRHIQNMEDHDKESWLIDVYKSINNWKKIDGKVRSLGITIAHLQGKYDSKKTVVTDDMIKAAKKVPFNKLLKLNVVGNQAKALCPFHNEKTPSFVVYANTNRGHCHGCGKNVDTIQFLVETKKIDFNQAVLRLLDY